VCRVHRQPVQMAAPAVASWQLTNIRGSCPCL
jgi:hypothetical protein